MFRANHFICKQSIVLFMKIFTLVNSTWIIQVNKYYSIRSENWYGCTCLNDDGIRVNLAVIVVLFIFEEKLGETKRTNPTIEHFVSVIMTTGHQKQFHGKRKNTDHIYEAKFVFVARSITECSFKKRKKKTFVLTKVAKIMNVCFFASAFSSEKRWHH